MDTISRESNSSYLPVAGVLVGALALIVGAAGFFKANSLGKRVPDDLLDQLAKVSAVEGEARNAAASADKANRDISQLTGSTQKAVDAIFGEINTMKSSVVKLEEASKARVAAPRKSSEPVVAGPGEYVVKPGDTGMKIARSIGVSIGDLQTVNPTVDWNHLKVGQKLKIPGK